MEAWERLQHIMELEGCNKNSFSAAIGLSNNVTITRIINEHRTPSRATLEKVVLAFPKYSINWLLTGEGEMIKSGVEVKPIHTPPYQEKIEEQASINLYDIEAAANLKTLLANKDENILGKISIPNIPKCDGAVYVRGDSMYPLLKSGDIIAYKEVAPDVRHIIFGEMYLVSVDMDGEEYLTVKYVNKSERGDDWVKLVSYNAHHEPKDFPIEALRAIAIVKMSIRMNVMR